MSHFSSILRPPPPPTLVPADVRFLDNWAEETLKKVTYTSIDMALVEVCGYSTTYRTLSVRWWESERASLWSEKVLESAYVSYMIKPLSPPQPLSSWRARFQTNPFSPCQAAGNQLNFRATGRMADPPLVPRMLVAGQKIGWIIMISSLHMMCF